MQNTINDELTAYQNNTGQNSFDRQFLIVGNRQQQQLYVSGIHDFSV